MCVCVCMYLCMYVCMYHPDDLTNMITASLRTNTHTHTHTHTHNHKTARFPRERTTCSHSNCPLAQQEQSLSPAIHSNSLVLLRRRRKRTRRKRRGWGGDDKRHKFQFQSTWELSPCICFYTRHTSTSNTTQPPTNRLLPPARHTQAEDIFGCWQSKKNLAKF